MRHLSVMMMIIMTLSCTVLVCAIHTQGNEKYIFDFESYDNSYLAYEQGQLWRQKHDVETLAPLILIPGLLASGLQDQLTDASLPLTCPKNNDWARIWIEPSRAARVNCFLAQLEQTYDQSTQTFYNTPGVEMSAIDFGGVHGLDYLAYTFNGQPINSTEYLQPLISFMEGAGYVVGENLAGAPYDWRQTTDPDNWNSKLKTLIEDLYVKNDDTPVYVMCHSMGNLEFTSFMETVDQTWKDKFVGGFISAAAPWSGASLAIRALVSGVDFSIGPVTIDPYDIAALVQTFGSVIWMTPTEYLMGTAPVVVTNTTSYNYSQFGQLFEDIGATTAEAIWEDLGNSLTQLPNPNVPLYCLYGKNKQTELWYEYDDGLFEQPTTIHYDDGGDGVVPLQSLLKCLDMDPVYSRAYNLVSHGELVKDPQFFNDVLDIVTGVIGPE